VRIKCGELFQKEPREEEVVETVEGEYNIKTIVVVAEWANNFGPNRFIRISVQE